MKSQQLPVFCVIFSVLLMTANCLPVRQENEEELENQLDHVGRVKRVTCDVLSANVNVLGSGGQLNHTACALHCIALRKSGGHCNGNGVCVCRK